MRKIFAAGAVVFSLSCFVPVPVVNAGEDALEAPAATTAPVAPVEPAAQSAMAAPAVKNKTSDGLSHHRLGLGVHYWRSIDNIGEEIDRDGFSYLATYQYAPVWFLKVEADVELFPDVANSGKEAWEPQVFVILGQAIYAGVGAGIYHFDGDWSTNPYYMLRAGFDFPVLPRLFLDLNLNYRFNDWHSLKAKDIGTETLRLGAALRFAL